MSTETQPFPEIGEQGRLILSVSLPRLARHGERVMQWLRNYDASQVRENSAALSQISGAEGLAVLAQLSPADRRQAVHDANLPDEQRDTLLPIVSQLGDPQQPGAPAAGLLKFIPPGTYAAGEPSMADSFHPSDLRDDEIKTLSPERLSHMAATVATWTNEKEALDALRLLILVGLHDSSLLPFEFWTRAIRRVKRFAGSEAPWYLLPMARIIAQQGELQESINTCHAILPLWSEVGDEKGKAATLHLLASVIAQQGDTDGALELWQESLDFWDRARDVQGRASTLYEMGWVISQQGNIPRALELWQQSLELEKQIGNVRGRAATLMHIAWAAGMHGDTVRERELSLQAASDFASVHAWPNLGVALHNLGTANESDAARYLAQAQWLILRIHLPVPNSVGIAAALAYKVGAQHPLAPSAAAYAVFLLKTRGQDHPQHEELKELILGVLTACAAVRQIPEDKIPDWMEAEGLNDPARFGPALEHALEEIVGEDGWLFDRTLLPAPDWEAQVSSNIRKRE
jgi:tetratricopeptide (TPR) repeat protein